MLFKNRFFYAHMFTRYAVVLPAVTGSITHHLPLHRCYCSRCLLNLWLHCSMCIRNISPMNSLHFLERFSHKHWKKTILFWFCIGFLFKVFLMQPRDSYHWYTPVPIHAEQQEFIACVVLKMCCYHNKIQNNYCHFEVSIKTWKFQLLSSRKSEFWSLTTTLLLTKF